MMTTEFLQGELERLFELESMMALSDELLGLAPSEVGGTNAKGAFARALVQRCAANDALLALSDAIRLSVHRTGSDVGQTAVPPPKDDELADGSDVGSFRLVKRLSGEALGT